MPLLTQKGGLRERSLFWHFPIYLERYGEGSPETRDRVFRTRPGSVIRTGDWKLHEYFEDGGVELYHLKEDIGETRNLANEFPEKAHELHDQLRSWRAATAAPVPTEPNPEYAPSEE
jgi:arylsulfatase A-like enzyme